MSHFLHYVLIYIIASFIKQWGIWRFVWWYLSLVLFKAGDKIFISFSFTFRQMQIWNALSKEVSPNFSCICLIDWGKENSSLSSFESQGTVQLASGRSETELDGPIMTWHRRLIKKEQGDLLWIWDTDQDISPNLFLKKWKMLLCFKLAWIQRCAKAWRWNLTFFMCQQLLWIIF